MKILWVNSNFMHPTTKGGQIRTLEMLRHLHRRHEIHYAALEDPARPEGSRRSHEYSFRAYPIAHRVPQRNSLAFIGQLARGLVSPMPLAVSRFYSPKMRAFLTGLIRRERFEAAVVDHLAPSSHFPDLEHSILFQHNVETAIWRRRAERAPDPLRRAYFRLQAERMFEYEGRVCRAAGHVVAVSDVDAGLMRSWFGVARVSAAPTGVNIEYFAPPARRTPVADLVFVGSLDWLPNVDGVLFFVREVLPLVRKRHPACTFAVAGRMPPREIAELPKKDPRILVTGTVPDIRPYLWGALVSVVPLRIGGGTRLKIYESMAAKVPVVSTTIGAEGLEINPPRDIRIGDSPEALAAQCAELLDNPSLRTQMAEEAWRMVSTRFTWENAARCFERVLESGPRLPPY